MTKLTDCDIQQIIADTFADGSCTKLADALERALAQQAAPEAPAADHERWMDCPDCDGYGRISSREKCARCNESGILPDTAPATQQVGSAELVTAMRDRVARIRYIDESSRKLLIQAADFIEKGTASPTVSSQFAKGEHTAATTASASSPDGYLNDDCDAPMANGACTECRFGPCRRAPAPSRDAARWYYCIKHGFPQCLSTGWWAPLPNGHLIGGKHHSPASAIDAAMSASQGKTGGAAIAASAAQEVK